MQAIVRTATVFELAVSPDGGSLLSGGGDGSLRLFDVSDDRLVEARVLSEPRPSLAPVALSPDGRHLAVGAPEKALEVWLDFEDPGKKTVLLAREHEGRLMTLAFSADGKMVAAGSSEGETTLWELPEEAPTGLGRRAVLRGPKGIVESMAFHPKGTVLATSNSINGGWGNPGSVRFWDVLAGNEVGSFLAHPSGMVRAMAYTPAGDHLLTGSADGTIRLWRLSESPPFLVSTLKGHTGRIWDLSVSRDGSLLASASDDLTIRVWDLGSAVELFRFHGHRDNPNRDPVYCVAFSPDGRSVFSGGVDRTIRRWGIPVGSSPK